MIESKMFWLFLALVVALPLLGLFNSNGSSQLVGNVAIQNIAYVQAGKELTFEVRDSDNVNVGISQITLVLSDAIKNGRVAVDSDETIPFDRNYYSKFTIISTDADKISLIRFLLKIKEQDLLQKGIAINDVRLYQSRKELETVLTKKEGDYVYYSATADSLGQFVIGKVAPKEESRITTAKEEVVAPEPAASVVEQPKVIQPENIAGEAAGIAEPSTWQRFKLLLVQWLG